jgi:hypothetical protein
VIEFNYMASLSLDTHKAITLLQQRGYSKQQAEGFVAVIQSADLADVATRDDISALKDDIAALERSISGARVEMYKVTAAQTLVIIGAVVALMQAF